MKIIGFLILLLALTSCSSNSSTNDDYCKDNPCKDSPIANKTVCLETDDDYTCICEENYELVGDICKLKDTTSPCEPNPCKNPVIANKSVCKEVGDDFSCECEAGYDLKEDKCVAQTTDLCKDIQCSADKECKVENEVASCVCKDGFILDGNICVEKPAQKLKIRVMAANLTTSIYQDYEFYGTSIMDAMNPDVILIQEFNYDLDTNGSTSDSEVEAMITEIYGENSGVHYYRGKDIILEPGDIPIPNGVISKYPILETGEWSDTGVPNRNFNYALLDIPGDKNLWAISLHLKAGSSDDGTRAKETETLMKRIAEKIPEGDYIVIGGDLNTRNRTEESIQNLAPLFKVTGPHPVDEVGKDGTNRSRRNPYDWVIASKSLAPSQISTDFCYSETSDDCKRYPNGLVFDSTKYSDYDLEVYFQPVESGDSRGGEMQHMGVIKDFEIEYQ